MATDFFQRQDNARRQTVRLVVLFGLSVVVIILAIYLLLAFTVQLHPRNQKIDVPKDIGNSHFAYNNRSNTTPGSYQPPPVVSKGLWNPQLFGWVSLGTLLVIGLGSFYKLAELAGGGEQVALMLGGRAVNPQTTDLAERRLLNVVEEMALASGIPVPPVFILDNEPGINAFAAGYQPSDAVVAVSAGSLRYLTRDELQGVMGHEFSHIVNGDMKLNLRLIGVIFGILVLAVIGSYMMRFTALSSSQNNRREGGGAAIFLLGVALMILGYLGVFFGKIIKCAISREREYLADASAVQFTRNPAGIAGALKKIGGAEVSSRIQDGHAEEMSHMFFSDALIGSFFNLFATHPPLEKRIRALEPDFDGVFPEVRPVTASADEMQNASRPRRRPVPSGTESAMASLAGSASVLALDADRIVNEIGQPQAKHLEYAGQLVEGIPQPLLDAVREPFDAPAVVFSLLLSRNDETTRQRQLALLESGIPSALFQRLMQLLPLCQAIPTSVRLPIVSMAVPSIKLFSEKQYGRFRELVQSLVGVDGKMDLYEYCLHSVLFSYLDVHFRFRKPPTVAYRSLEAVAQPLAMVLSTLAYVGHQQPETIQRAYRAGMQNLSGPAEPFPMEQCTLQTFDAALGTLAQSSPQVKRSVVESVTACIAADNRVTPEESELLRAVAAVLGCPVPPLDAAIDS